MIIGIDHGNAQIKTRNTCFVSGVEEFPTKPPMAADVIQYQSRYWTLVGKRLPVMRDKTKDDRFYLLTLFAISKELEARKEITSTLDIDLAVGLPPEHYGMLKDSFAQYFRRQETVRFTYNDKPFSLMLDHVFVYPQAFGAVVQRAQEMTETAEPRASNGHMQNCFRRIPAVKPETYTLPRPLFAACMTMLPMAVMEV